MKVKFTKMQGLGNDFVVFDGIHQKIDLGPKQLQWLADRHFGIGCDQILLVEAPGQAGVDFKYRIFNADGSEVSQCGNGARCFARYVREKGLTSKNDIVVETHAGIMRLHVNPDRQVTVNMGVPCFEPAQIPLQQPKAALSYTVDTAAGPVEFGAVSLGNPHAVLLVEDVETAPVAELGPLLESHEVFPERANIGFLQVIDKNFARLRVYERGSGETLACGSGACAAMVIGQRWGLLGQRVTMGLPGGELICEWQGNSHPVMMTGPAEFVFEGEVDL